MNDLVVHKPFIDGQCGGCHDPHATNNEWVLKKSSEEICLNCHKPDTDLLNHRHPYNTKPKKKLASDLKLTPDGLLECLSCHNPHSSKQPHMLKTEMDAICIGCHMDLL
jgi:predicted CXXCH cytochrome family protein